MKVPFSDISLQHKELRKEIKRSIDTVIKRGDFILGKEVAEFEEEFARFCRVPYAVGVSSGTAALFLALKSLDVKKGDEVIVPAFTFIATALAVSYTGARPVFADIEEDSYNIDAAKLKKAINKNTKAIIPVHLYGQPARMSRILEIAKTYDLKVIEDAAQAHGAGIKMPDGRWRLAGTLGTLGCFSFYPSKNLGGLGDGGMVITRSRELYVKLAMLRDQGRVSKYDHCIIGYNSRLDTLQAAVLRVKLGKLMEWNLLRRKNAGIYSRMFKNTPVITPRELPFVRHIYHVYAVRIKNRDKVNQRLRERGVNSLIHYPIPLHLQRAYQDLGYVQGDFPVAEKVSSEIISLPMYPHLKEEQIRYVVDSVKESLDN
ncbi:MAG: DegT/DnrJ/EryC1/StrS family aminotransferase [Candidatus Omnitrophota bacterium]|nr:DegT/DnrJ/EryC1/StrS family aminotransferase [Candidatus Omnitrophota bacterium]